MKLYIRKYLMIVLAVGSLSSCTSFLEIDPPKTQLVKETVFENDATAKAAMAGVYNQMTTGITGGGLGSIGFLTALSSDELVWQNASGANAREFYESNVLPSNAQTSTFWGEAYSLIYQVNAVIEGVHASTTLSTSVQRRLEGEAKFIRAFYHFYLTNLFGRIPYIKTTDYRLNRDVSRADVQTVYDEIINDLEEAYSLLAADYTTTNNQRIVPTKWAAKAMLSRVFLYQHRWQESINAASEVILQTEFFELEQDLTKVFLRNSREAIFQILPPVGATYTNEGNIFLRSPSYSSLSAALVDAFDADDLRAMQWVGAVANDNGTFYYPTKYKEFATNATGAESSMVLRLAELYLTRAEAQANLDLLEGAIEGVDKIRTRSGLAPLATVDADITKEELLQEISHQRRLELFTEWGHRWFDLKRTEKIDAVLGAIKPSWNAFDVLFPIPEKEILTNPNLQPQNSGY
ncbi:RagB/SusD family nutrient uptake outer membrane protein [Pseudochryseolinea flava]|uniref:RagB/SusD family nutrient uptake outer membrane protein n=1 Tax=Pseudochryseolinea flava TaxID=2059302 RepID=A0A364Y5D9_9BACT|nr:RagB/SusD family nutrient uptake outer membrane protein [Pseudochryseolinea flava]RAW01571.1 RagB/SusD family nutrient uptake outer membrane protein [Pseudochryseolinea flava]